jgi:transposase
MYNFPLCGTRLTGWGCRLKKTVHASEQQREDVQKARTEWKENQLALDPAKLVFIDETWASTNMARRYGRAPKSERLVAHVPHGHWKTTTFIAALRVGGVAAPMVADGPINGEFFLKYVQEFLCPILNPGDIVIMDNLSSHKVEGVREAIEAVGAELRYLPPYSPDFNPIELYFSKLKSALRTLAERTVDALWIAIGNIYDAVTPTHCNNFFHKAGYAVRKL